MKATVNYFTLRTGRPFEGQSVIVVNGGDVFSGIYESGRFRLHDSEEGFPFDTDHVEYWVKAGELVSEVNK